MRRLRRPKRLLLDANIAIETIERDCWERLARAIEIVLPSRVALEVPDLGIPRGTSGEIQIVGRDGRPVRLLIEPVSQEEIDDLHGQFTPEFDDGIDAGEAECFALMIAGRAEDCHFCTGDGPAIKALALLGFSEWGMSLENVLISASLRLPDRLPFWFLNDYFQHQLDEGKAMRIQNRGLARDSRFRLRLR